MMGLIGGSSSNISEEAAAVLKYFSYDENTEIITASKAIETTLNSLYLGEQHKMSSGSENIYFTNLSSDINFFPMWGGLKDQSVPANRDSTGFIPPSGRIYSDMFSLPLGGAPDAGTSVGYAGNNYFGVNITGVGITTVAAEDVPSTVKLQYRITIGGIRVYSQTLPRGVSTRSTANVDIAAGDTIEWFFDHPVDVAAGTTLFAEIHKVNKADDTDLGVFQVRQGDTVDPNTGLLRYQATVHNRLYQDKDLELISPYLKYQAMDFQIDASGSTVSLRDLSLGSDSVLAPHAVNTLQAVANGTTIRIKLRNGQKILVDSLPVNATSINGSFVNAVLNQAVTELNALFTNTLSFASQGNAVTDFALTGNDLTITLADGTSYTQDVTSFGVDENNFVVSGAVSGSDLILTMSDASTITIDATNLVGGSTLSATNEEWYISYGANANTAVGANSMDTTTVGGVQLRLQGPYYFGKALTRGAEFKFNMNTGNTLRLGIWDGAAVATSYIDLATAANWNTVFSYANGANKFTSSTNTDVTSYHASGYSGVSNAPMSIRFGTDGHLTLLDLSGGNEVVVGKTTIALSATSINLQMGGFSGSVFPNGIINDSNFLWEVVHDYANTEDGVLNGVLAHTVLKRTLALSPGEQLMIPLTKQGAGDTFGIDYTGAGSGVITAEDNLLTSFKFQTNESIIADANWAHNTTSSRYFIAGGAIPSWRQGGAGTVQGLFSLRYMTDNTLELWSETYNDLVATTVAHPDGSPINLHFGVDGNTAYIDLPSISKQAIGQGSQPDVNFAPVVADQTVSITEATALSFQVVSSDNVVNQFAELDAPSWLSMDQTTGILSGTAPAHAGTAADTIVVSCKAGNAIGGTVEFTVTVTVASSATYTNTSSLRLNGTTAFLQGNPTTMNALDRVTNGDGDAWTMGMWVKVGTGTGWHTLMAYGTGDMTTSGVVALSASNTTLVLNFGVVNNRIVSVVTNAIVANTWHHIMVTFDGGTTGVDSASLGDYHSRFSIVVDGVVKTGSLSHAGNGYDGAISGANASNNLYRIGRHNNIFNEYANIVINQLAFWDTDETANIATIYNSGVPQDLSLLASSPAHYYEIGSSVTTVTDLVGNANLTGYNFVSGDLVTDTP